MFALRVALIFASADRVLDRPEPAPESSFFRRVGACHATVGRDRSLLDRPRRAS
jgi:hypothetical protein